MGHFVLTGAASDMTERRHEVPEAGWAPAEDAGGRRRLLDDVVDRVGRAAEAQQAVVS